ncbi:Bifunctional oligoribonuclease and PAP phosphatase NrnA [Planctomycetales bacterium 10988]|nr:Bifunctional oligoribonuclease and PAP phosphatase NrnA [Planctomycetales bacterium 10988]
MTIDWEAFTKRIQEVPRWTLTTHVNPDCDALGSELGVAAILRKLGKEVQILNADPVPHRLEFLLQGETIYNFEEHLEELMPLTGGILILDTSAWKQLNSMGQVVRESELPKLVLDHHVSEDDLKATMFKDSTAEATGALVVDWLDYLGLEITPEMAFPLFAAMVTDTGWFRFRSTTGKTFRRASKLIDAGARPEALYHQLYEQQTLNRLHLVGQVTTTLRLSYQGRLADCYARLQDFDRFGALPSDTEEVVNQGLRIQGTEAAFILVEVKPNEWKVSFRSRAEVDVSKIAGMFGGGGHRNASGARMSGEFLEVRDTLMKAFSPYFLSKTDSSSE